MDIPATATRDPGLQRSIRPSITRVAVECSPRTLRWPKFTQPIQAFGQCGTQGSASTSLRPTLRQGAHSSQSPRLPCTDKLRPIAKRLTTAPRMRSFFSQHGQGFYLRPVLDSRRFIHVAPPQGVACTCPSFGHLDIPRCEAIATNAWWIPGHQRPNHVSKVHRRKLAQQSVNKQII